MGQKQHAGFITIIGKPNAGKSTLLNALLGQKLAIVNPKAQTTRHRILGIVNHNHCQMVFSDTPGIIQPSYKLQEEMMRKVTESMEDADVVINNNQHFNMALSVVTGFIDHFLYEKGPLWKAALADKDTASAANEDQRSNPG